MVEILQLRNYTIPYCGNKRILPYGDLVVTDGSVTKLVKIKETDNGTQYFTFNRKRYEIRNAGKLYAPNFVIIGSMLDVIALLDEAGYKYEHLSDDIIRIFYKDGSGDFTHLEPCDDSRIGCYSIEGKVQNFREWIYR